MKENKIMCGRAADSEPVFSSEKVPCDRCKEDVWITKVGRDLVKEHDLEVVCVQCVVVEKGGLPQELGITGAQLNEIAEHQRRQKMN